MFIIAKSHSQLPRPVVVVAVALLAASALGCDRNDAAPQDLESGKTPTGTIEPASDRVDRVKTDEAGEATSSAAGTKGASGGGATTAPSAAAGGGSGGAPGAGR
ncbi:MAG: hypothetical protein EOO73_13995 [Myxococcales bacterium]|nr:MAG: hypothetical protein EOO73_13995 [Myxococcales bacterium]